MRFYMIHSKRLVIKTYTIFIYFLISGFGTLFSQNISQIPSEKPKLVIGIVIDQMRYDYLFKFWNKYENNGFKRLVNEGSFCKNANFNYLSTQSNCGFATIATGANPSAHGIISDEWYLNLSDKIARNQEQRIRHLSH